MTLTPFNPQFRSQSAAQYPQLLRYFKLDYYLDPVNNKFIRLTSTHPGSIQSRVNRVLDDIENDSWNHAYLMNRLREQIAGMVLWLTTQWGVIKPASIANDLLCGVDAIVEYSSNESIAIDFTEDYHRIATKIRKPDNQWLVQIYDINNNTTKLPFWVVYIESCIVVPVMQKLEKKIWINPQLSISEVRTIVKDFIIDIFKKDLMPQKLFQVYLPASSTSVPLRQLSQWVIDFTGEFTQKIPPPSR